MPLWVRAILAVGMYEWVCVCGGGQKERGEKRKKRENSYRMQETLNPSLAQFQFGQFRSKKNAVNVNLNLCDSNLGSLPKDENTL